MGMFDRLLWWSEAGSGDYSLLQQLMVLTVLLERGSLCDDFAKAESLLKPQPGRNLVLL